MNERKIALVTGGTSGVGLSIVKALVQSGYFVVFIGSSESKGKKLELKFNTRNSSRVRYVRLDLSHLCDVHHFTQDFIQQYGRLDVLANVAGVVLPKRETTQEGFEKTFAIGYLSPFVLSLKLLPALKRSESARIVNVSAQANAVLNTSLNFDNLDFSKSYNGFKTSMLTIHAKTVLTQILAEKFAVFCIDVNSFHPGLVRSELTRNLPLIMRILAMGFSIFMSQRSDNGSFVSASKKLKGSSGQLYVNKKATPLRFENTYKETLWLKTKDLLSRLEINFNEQDYSKVDLNATGFSTISQR